MTDVWDLVRAEREDLADFVSTLEDAAWDAQSLCADWRVRDVAGHVIGTSELKLSGGMILETLKAGFNVNRMIAADGIRRGNAAPSEIVSGLRAMVASRHQPPMVKPVGLLVDVVLHQSDIRRPLGKQRVVPEEQLVAVLEELSGYRTPSLNARKKVAGLRLVASDVSWKLGDGPEVSGPGEALAMAMGGRRAALDDLSGEGKEILASRL